MEYKKSQQLNFMTFINTKFFKDYLIINMGVLIYSMHQLPGLENS